MAVSFACRRFSSVSTRTLRSLRPNTRLRVTGIKPELLTECFDTAFAKRYDPLAGVYQGSINYAVTHEHTGNALKTLHPIEVLDVLRGVMDTPGGHRAATKAASVNTDQSTNIIGQYLRTGDAKAGHIAPDEVLRFRYTWHER